MAGGLKTGFEGSAPKVSGGTSSGLSTGFEGSSVVPTTNVSPRIAPGGASRGPQSRQKPEVSAGSALNWLGSKLSLAGHDIAQTPGALYHVAKSANHDLLKASDYVDRRLGTEIPGERKAGNTPWETPGVAYGFLKNTEETIKHPLRDPFQTLLTAGMLAGGSAGIAARARAATEAEGIAGKAAALAKKPAMPMRSLKVPQLLKDENHTPLPTEEHLTNNPRDRFIPITYRSPKNISIGKPGESHAGLPKGTQGYALVEDGKISRVNFTPPKAGNDLRGLGDFIEKYDRNPDIQNAVKSAVESKFSPRLKVVHQPVHLVESHAPLARAFQALHDRILQRSLDKNLTAEKPSLVTRYANARVGRANDEIARIAANTRNVAVKKLAGIKNFDDGIAKGHGQLALFLRSANVLPHEAADFWNEQAAAGVNPEQTLRLAQWANELHHSKVLHVGDDGKVAINAAKYPILGRADQLVKANQLTREHIIGEHNLMSPEGVKARKALVAETMHSEAARNAATGVREGQGYTNLSVSEKRAPMSPFARASSPHIPKPKPFSLSHEATGEGVKSGLIPDSTTHGVARSTAEALRFLGTKEHRELLHRYGSDVKRFKDDILVADPSFLKTGKLPLKTRQFLGLEKSTLHTLPQGEEAGVRAAIKARLEDAIPRMANKDAARLEDQVGVGFEAPQGYRWVPKQMARDIVESATPRNKAVRGINDINSAITGATVYFKLSHIPQRLATDATTSALSGALFKPSTLKAAMELRKELTTQEYEELAASTGTHGYQALPAEGESKIAHFAQKGAGFYAHRIDSPFRFLNLVHEARKAGIKDAAEMRDLIKAAKDPAKATPEQLSVLKRANRVSMIYDGLGPNEKRIITRGLWFYPWTKASVRFTGHTIAEHPLASAITGQLGAQEAKRSTAKLGGKVPYYEFGLTPVGHNEVSDFSRLSPFSTAADVLQTPSHLEQIRGNLNPFAAGLIDALTGTNSYGQQESRGKAALGDITAPTPEAQILSGYLARHSDQSNKMFPKSGKWYGTHDPLLRALLGTAVPRKVNKDALAKATMKRRTISVPAR